MGWLPWLTAGLAMAMASKQDLVTEEFPLLMPKVKPSLAETYICTPIRMDTELSYSIVGFRPNATKMTAHHMLIYGCEEPGSKKSTWNCGEMAVKAPGMESHQPCGSGSQIIYAWAMDAPKLDLPEGVGFRVGADSTIKYLVLQVHYASVDYISPEGDDSGVILEYTEEEQPKTAGVLLLGTGGSAPAHSTTYFETSCEIEDSRQIHPFAFRTHTHSLGKVVFWLEGAEPGGVGADREEEPPAAADVLPCGEQDDPHQGGHGGGRVHHGQQQGQDYLYRNNKRRRDV